jgi:hypothetical protein
MTIVYILTNEAMLGYIKIGLTELDVQSRMLSLDNTSVPLPFQCYYAARVSDSRRVERALHTGFGDHRVRNSREFFTIDPFRVKAVLEVLAIEDVTPREEIVANSDDEVALERATRSQKRFDITGLGIPIGATLNYVHDESIVATVAGQSSVMFNGVEMSLTKAATLALESRGYRWKSVQGPAFWLYNGETLTSIKQEAESANTSDE